MAASLSALMSLGSFRPFSQCDKWAGLVRPTNLVTSRNRRLFFRRYRLIWLGNLLFFWEGIKKSILILVNPE